MGQQALCHSYWAHKLQLWAHTMQLLSHLHNYWSPRAPTAGAPQEKPRHKKLVCRNRVASAHCSREKATCSNKDPGQPKINTEIHFKNLIVFKNYFRDKIVLLIPKFLPGCSQSVSDRLLPTTYHHGLCPDIKTPQTITEYSACPYIISPPTRQRLGSKDKEKKKMSSYLTENKMRWSCYLYHQRCLFIAKEKK